MTRWMPAGHEIQYPRMLELQVCQHLLLLLHVNDVS